MALQVMAWDKNSQEGQFITGLDAERVIVNEMRKKVGFQFKIKSLFFHFGTNVSQVEVMKTLLTPSHSIGPSVEGSMCGFSPGGTYSMSITHHMN